MSMDGIDCFAVREEQRINKEYPGLLAMVRKFSPKTGREVGMIIRAYIRHHNIDNEDYIFYKEITNVEFAYKWSENRIFYQFDHALSKSLLKQAKRIKDAEQLPCELLKNLPYTCIAVKVSPFYIEKAGQKIEFTGNFYLKCKCVNNRTVLSGLWELKDWNVCGIREKLVEIYLPIIDGGTIKDSIDALYQDWIDVIGDIPALKLDDAKSEMFPPLLAMQIVLYLQAENADIQNRPNAHRKKNPKVSAPKIKPVKVVNVGYRIGRFLRSVPASSGESTGTGSVKCPHSRRGHWHHFWTGSKNNPDERKLVLKWVAPTMIHGNKIGNTVTIMNVK